MSTKSQQIKVDARFGDWDDFNSYRGPHNQETGPGQYSLPALVAVDHKPLSTLRNSPRLSIGLPNYKNKPYFPEVSSEFIGRNSPAVTKYSPSMEATKTKEPEFSISKFQRFHKPSSLANLQATLPT